MAKNLTGDIKNLCEIEHQFGFDLCILKEEDIIKYNPLCAALTSKENFKTEASFQISQNQYKSLVLKSFTFGGNKAILLSDLSYEIENKELKEQNSEYRETINNLEEANKEHSILKEKAEAQAIRTGLINRIAGSIRDTLDIDDIIKTAINEISKALVIKKGVFVNIDNNKYTVGHVWDNNRGTEFIESKTDLDNDPQ